MRFAMTTDNALKGITVAVTRPQASSGQLTDALTRAGAAVLGWPVFSIELVRESEQALRTSAKMSQWIVFTSANGVESFASLGPANLLEDRRIASIGPATTDALSACGVQPEVIATTHTSEGLVEAIRNYGDVKPGARALYPCAEDARSVLSVGLSKLGIIVDKVVTYRKIPVESAIAIDAPPDAVTFASPSAAKTLDGLFPVPEVEEKIKRQSIAICIGPLTAAAASDLGYRNVLIAKSHTNDGMVAALVEQFTQRNEDS